MRLDGGAVDLFAQLADACARRLSHRMVVGLHMPHAIRYVTPPIHTVCHVTPPMQRCTIPLQQSWCIYAATRCECAGMLAHQTAPVLYMTLFEGGGFPLKFTVFRGDPSEALSVPEGYSAVTLTTQRDAKGFFFRSADFLLAPLTLS